MKPKEKAIELVEKFKNTTHPISRIEVDGVKCALICVEEILNDNPNIYDSDRLNHNYWKEVKNEIEKL